MTSNVNKWKTELSTCFKNSINKRLGIQQPAVLILVDNSQRVLTLRGSIHRITRSSSVGSFIVVTACNTRSVSEKRRISTKVIMSRKKFRDPWERCFWNGCVINRMKGGESNYINANSWNEHTTAHPVRRMCPLMSRGMFVLLANARSCFLFTRIRVTLRDLTFLCSNNQCPCGSQSTIDSLHGVDATLATPSSALRG